MALISLMYSVFVVFLLIIPMLYAKEYCYPPQVDKASGSHMCILSELSYNFNYHLCCSKHKIADLKSVPIPNNIHPLPPGCAVPLSFEEKETIHCPPQQSLLSIAGTKMCCTNPSTGTGIQSLDYGKGQFKESQNMVGGSYYNPLTAPYARGLNIDGRMLNPTAAIQMGLNLQGQPIPNLPGTPNNVGAGFMNDPMMTNNEIGFNPSNVNGPTKNCRNYMDPINGDSDCNYNATNRCLDPNWQIIMFTKCAGTCLRMGVKVAGCGSG